MDYATEFRQGNFRSAETYWIFFGFASLAIAAVLGAAVCGWHPEGHALERAVPGNYLDSEDAYLTLAGSCVTIKLIEYVGLIASTGLAGVCYAMGTK